MIQSRLEGVVAGSYDTIMGFYGASINSANIAKEKASEKNSQQDLFIAFDISSCGIRL